jgi:glycosyltransferase involved in cell wall biosynthesis
LKLVIVHSHFRPGGVRRVIETATPHLVAHRAARIDAVVLVGGETPEPAWLKLFRDRLRSTPVELLIDPAFGYHHGRGPKSRDLRRRITRALARLIGRTAGEESLVWAHNLALGRNLCLARALTIACRRAGIPLIAHHHDWWFENRWQHFAAWHRDGLRGAATLAEAVFPRSSRLCHIAVNRADTAVLARHFPRQSGWLPNPVERVAGMAPDRVEMARAWLRDRLGDGAPVWLVPCRLLRRKNLAEALLLARWLRPGAWLVTTGGVSSPEEQPYADALSRAASTRGWRLRLAVLSGSEASKPSVQELLAASEAVLLTSLQEGFGLPYLEAPAARRPLIARELPNVAPDLARFGFRFPQAYREIEVCPTLFDWSAEVERQERRFASWRSLMPRNAARRVGAPALLRDTSRPHPVPFSRLTLLAQLEVLSRPNEASWLACKRLNPFLSRWRARAAGGRLGVSRWPRRATGWLGGASYAARFFRLVPRRRVPLPHPAAGRAALANFLRRKLASENLYPILWHPLP